MPSELENDIRFMLGEISGGVKTLIEQGRIQDDRHNELEGRVRVVENRQHWYAGLAAAVGSGLTFLGKSFFGAH